MTKTRLVIPSDYLPSSFTGGVGQGVKKRINEVVSVATRGAARQESIKKGQDGKWEIPDGEKFSIREFPLFMEATRDAIRAMVAKYDGNIAAKTKNAPTSEMGPNLRRKKLFLSNPTGRDEFVRGDSGTVINPQVSINPLATSASQVASEITG